MSQAHDHPDPLRNIHNNPHQKGTLQALGLGKIGRKVEREDSPQLQGQLKVVTHLVEVEEN